MLPRKPIVWVLQDPAPDIERDYSSCQGYGEVKTVLKFEEQPSKHFAFCFNKMLNTLEEMEDGDYVISAGGDPLTPVLAGMCFILLGINKFIWLRWDRRTDEKGHRTRHGYYTPQDIITEDL